VIVTVTLNPAVDKTLIVQGFKAGATNRATIDRIEIGGKGINVARMLRQLGCDVIATGFLAADDRYGTTSILAHHGIDADFVSVVGETRVNLKVIDVVGDIETEINEPGFEVSGAAVASLAAKLRSLARDASVIVLSGSLPPGAPVDLYAQLLAVAQAEGARTMLDTAGAALAHGLAARPDLVKPNRAEAEELLGAAITDESSLLTAADRILAMGSGSVVISLGPDGALSASPNGIWRARSPVVKARNTVGAGDTMMAVLAYGLMKSMPPLEALRLATAAGCAAATVADRYPSSSEIQTVLPQILVERFPAAAGAHPWTC
jgi:1-phosphofructokinase